MGQILQLSCTYFGIVFSIGFIFGVIRVLFVAPYLGDEKAEILEAPLMILVSYLASRYIVSLAGRESAQAKMIVVGILALLYLLAVEFSFVLWLREIALAEYLSSKYSMAGVTYMVSLFLYTIFPYIVYRAGKK